MARKLLRGRARLLKHGKVYIERDTLMYEARDAHDRVRQETEKYPVVPLSRGDDPHEAMQRDCRQRMSRWVSLLLQLVGGVVRSSVVGDCPAIRRLVALGAAAGVRDEPTAR